MSNEKNGLYKKYHVERVDGKPLKGRALVLEFGDPNAFTAILKYAKSMRKNGCIKLAEDIEKNLNIQKRVDYTDQHSMPPWNEHTDKEKTIKYKYIGATDAQVKWGNNDDPRLLMEIEDIVTLDGHPEIHTNHTKLAFKEYPGMKFNSTSFKLLKDVVIAPEYPGRTGFYGQY